MTTTYINNILATKDDLALFHWHLAIGSAEILETHIIETDNKTTKNFIVGY